MLKQNLQITGIITFASIQKDQIEGIRYKIKNDLPLDDYKQTTKHNIIVDVGLNVLMRLLAGETTYSGEINYGALGDGTGTPASGDTVMENEIYRKLASSASYDNKTAYVDFFYEKEDVDGSFTRFANFIDGGAGADSGQMFSHVVVDWTKTEHEGLFVACRYIISYSI